MISRWMASAFLRTEKRFQRIMGHRDLWALEAILNPTATAGQNARSNINLATALRLQLGAEHARETWRTALSIV
jgi:hypothetical protein